MLPRVLCSVLLLFGLTGLLASQEKKDRKSKAEEVLPIGMSDTAFHEVPEDQSKDAMKSLEDLVKKQTGMRGVFTTEKEIDKLAEQLTNDKYKLGVFMGYEFAWAHQKNPKLKPLVIAINEYKVAHAHLLVRADSSAKEFGDLKGKPFAMPNGSKAHCRLVLERRCQAQGKDAKDFFEKVTTPTNIEEALDDVIEGKVQATLVDGYGLERYRKRKPGLAKKLKELQKSEAFPADVVVYYEGHMSDDDLRRFRDGMIKSHKDDDGKRTLGLWKLSAFELVPKDYEKTVEAIAKAYPPPEKK